VEKRKLEKREVKGRFLGRVLLLGVLMVLLCGNSGLSQETVFTNIRTSDIPETLFHQSVVHRLDREVSDHGTSFLLLDVRTGSLLASHWDNPQDPIPMGSLVKPFTALAYGKAHEFHYPTHYCAGEASGCWLPRGHGEVGMTSAIAYSCNSYFRMLTTDMSREQMTPTAEEFGLDLPTRGLSGSALSGLGGEWRISPLHLARAFLELNRRREQPGVREILAGMAESSRIGTGVAVGRSLRPVTALVKTGTAACTHSKRAPGDGFVVALVPASQPELLLLVRVHGEPGAKAAITAGRLLNSIYAEPRR
jgi:cell division protein FtsI/penicillin-binding protein 2